MPINETIEKDFLAAYKAKDEAVLSVLRMLKSTLKNKQIELKIDSLNDTEVIGIIRKEIKQRKESADEFEKGKRSDLAEKELAEAEILQKYLPAELSDDEIKEIVKSALAESGVTDSKDFGKAMSFVMPRLAGKADGSKISAIVRELLG